jgi:YD repeat-containing protein
MRRRATSGGYPGATPPRQPAVIPAGPALRLQRTTSAYDRAGRETDRETKTGSVSRAHYTWTYNRAGLVGHDHSHLVLSEASTITGDSANGTVAYAYDPLGQLVASGLSGTTTTYGWDATTNRTSVTVGSGTAATTAYDAANRPTSGSNPAATYASDQDGRLTARPGQTMTWDHLGRLTAVKDAPGTTTIASYTYHPLDRLRIADDGSVRPRHQGPRSRQ